LASPLRLLPTPIGGLRPAAIVPEGQAAGLSAWGRDEGLLLLGIDRYRDFWPHYAARNLRRQAWADGPAEIRGASVELPGLATLPPSVPGMRLFEALRARATQKGATMQIGFEVVRVGHERDRVTTVETDATVRSLVLRAGEVVLATGGIAGGGLRASREGVLEERVIGLPVEAPARGSWLAGDLYGTGGIRLAAGAVR